MPVIVTGPVGASLTLTTSLVTALVTALALVLTVRIAGRDRDDSADISLAQRRHSDTQVISNLLARQSAGQHDTHRMFAKFVRSSMSQSPSPLLQ